MRRLIEVACGGILTLSLATGAGADLLTNNLQELIDEKNAAISGIPNPPQTAVGGDDIGSAVLIGGLPYSDAGNTCGFTNDYDYACPYTGSTSGDVVYKYLPTSAQRITVDVCNSGYDTKLYIYKNAADNVVACNDDGCNDPAGNPYRSRVSCVTVTPGNTYYIVIDGYGGDCGSYLLSVSASSDCPETCVLGPLCPPVNFYEGEPLCGSNYIDEFNGGCSSDPVVFSSLQPCRLTLCGESGTFSAGGLSYRDTDWYEMLLPIPWQVTFTVCASFDLQIAAIDGNAGCGFITFLCPPQQAPEYVPLTCSFAAPTGPNWLFVAPSVFSGVPCGSKYLLVIEEAPAICEFAIESTSWGSVKALFR